MWTAPELLGYGSPESGEVNPPSLVLETMATMISRITERPHPISEKVPAAHSPPGLVWTLAERLAQEAEERMHKRQLMLAEQCSIDNAPDVRIRAWERAHALRLPSDPGHPVLRSVAVSTGLTIAQVLEEQSIRQARRVASAKGQGPDSSA